MRDGTYTGPATDVVVEVAGHPWLALNQQYIFITRVRGADH
jgi:hypothetical protein